MKIERCEGNGQGSCKRCSDNGIWNMTWACFLYKIEGYEGCYCYDCAKILSHGQIKQTLKNKISQEQS